MHYIVARIAWKIARLAATVTVRLVEPGHPARITVGSVAELGPEVGGILRPLDRLGLDRDYIVGSRLLDR